VCNNNTPTKIINYLHHCLHVLSNEFIFKNLRQTKQFLIIWTLANKTKLNGQTEIGVPSPFIGSGAFMVTRGWCYQFPRHLNLWTHYFKNLIISLLNCWKYQVLVQIFLVVQELSQLTRLLWTSLANLDLWSRNQQPFQCDRCHVDLLTINCYQWH